MSCWDRIRCIAFDFDGTLVESNAIKRRAFFEVFDAFPAGGSDKQADAETDREAVVERVLAENPDADRSGIVREVRAALVARGARSLPQPISLVDAYTRLCEVRVVACPAVPGALEALEHLCQIYPLYLDSSTPEAALKRIVERRGWSPFFRAVLGRPADKVENLRTVAEREKLAPREILLVGDGPPDAAAAQEFECAFLGFERDGTTLRGHPGLDALAPLVDELHSRSS
jgi:phosphoglycolate phosphatase-like HAD superfamily hydrolase